MKRIALLEVLAAALPIAISLATTPLARAQTTEPILVLETGMHTAPIFRISTDAANRYLATASEDKTVRVWDISSGNAAVPVRVLRPPIDKDKEGQLFAVAMTPDGTTIACAGWTAWDWEGSASIYLFDLTTGALTRRLAGQPKQVNHLLYSADGRFLVAMLREAGMRLYRTSDYSVVAEDKDYGNRTPGASFDRTGTRLVTSCYDGYVRLYDLAKLEAHPGVLPQQLAPVSKIRPPGGSQPYAVAVSPDGARVAVGFNESPKVDVLEISGATLQHAYSPDSSGLGGKRDLSTVAWSFDGRFLYAGGTYAIGSVRQIRKWSEGGRGRHADIPATKNSIRGLLPLRAGGVAFSAADPAFGVFDASDRRTFFQAATIADHRDNWDGFLISPDASALQFGYDQFGKSQALFSLKDRALTNVSSSLWAGLKAAVTFTAPLRDGIEVTDWKYTHAPKLGGKPLRFPEIERSLSLAIMPDRSGFVLGCDWDIRLFDPTGKQRWRVPLSAAAWGVNTNGKVVLATLADGTIRWYRASDGKELLAFFPHNEQKRWILWTPSGYYDASPGAEDLIGWHLNRGKEREAEFFPASRFRSTYYRPDVIDRVLTTMDEAVALRQANEESGRKQVAEVSVREKLPPVVSIVAPSDGTEVSSPTVTLRYSARSQEPLTGLKVLVDGRPVSIEGIGKTPKESGDLAVPIPPRDCEVSVIAENRHAPSESATVRLRWKGASAKEDEFQIKPKLYVLAVGVSQYQDVDLRLGLAAKDALDFGEVWRSQKGALYAGVEARVLTDAQATKGSILDGLEWLQRQVTQKDVAILFFAGHGINDPNGMFYFLPVDADLEKLKRTGISQSDITSTVATIAGKVLVFMDACHSGNLMGKVKRRAVVDIGAVINELAAAENGAVVFSSSTGRQYSMENPEWGNGAFTKGLVEAIRGKADYKSTGRITVNMLDLYLSERVKELTQGQQTPATVKPPNMPDFPVVVLGK